MARPKPLRCPNVYCTMCDDFKSTQDATLALLNKGINDILFSLILMSVGCPGLICCRNILLLRELNRLHHLA